MNHTTFSRLGGLASAAALTPEQRTARAKLAADAATAKRKATHATNGAFGTQVGKFSRSDRFDKGGKGRTAK